ncbi:hypothetical protein TNCV_1269041 [Trichonephila clavipes]|nr:hypothetical protein TNCV_1269041 [Trichonephila clavipes]
MNVKDDRLFADFRRQVYVQILSICGTNFVNIKYWVHKAIAFRSKRALSDRSSSVLIDVDKRLSRTRSAYRSLMKHEIYAIWTMGKRFLHAQGRPKTADLTLNPHSVKYENGNSNNSSLARLDI